MAGTESIVKEDHRIELEHYSGVASLAQIEVVSGLYRRVFSLPPFNADERVRVEQRDYYVEAVGRDGFRLCLAKLGGRYVGFSYGHFLEPLSEWWSAVIPLTSASFKAEAGRRAFVIDDYGVLVKYRRLGIGRAIHDAILEMSGAERATLAVRQAAVATQAIYRRWGWRYLGPRLLTLPGNSTAFDVLVLDAIPRRAPSA